MKTAHKSRSQQLQDHVHRYREAGNPWPTSSTAIARWAIEAGLCQPEPTSFERSLARDFSRALREDYFTDPQGRRVRRNHPFSVRQLKDGEYVQTTLWGDMKTMTRGQMLVSMQHRRQGIRADCIQLDTDLESYNENYNLGDKIQISLNFEEDVEEAKMSADYEFTESSGDDLDDE